MTSHRGPKRAAGLVGAGLVVATCAVGLAARAYGSPCDPMGLSMTQQPVLSCGQPEAPAPGQAPYVPPVAKPDGTQPDGQLGFLREIWHEFHNGVPSDFIPGPMPPPPNSAEPPPGAPVPPPPPTP